MYHFFHHNADDDANSVKDATIIRRGFVLSINLMLRETLLKIFIMSGKFLQKSSKALNINKEKASLLLRNVDS